MRGRGAALVVSIVASSSGCTLLASATVHHNSRGRACMQSPLPSVIDLLLATGSLAATVSDDDAAWGWFIVPSVLGTIGVIGMVTSASCRGEAEDKASPTEIVPANNTAPAFGEAPVDPEAREPSFEERTPASTTTPSPLFDRHGIPTGVHAPDPTPVDPAPPPRPRPVSDPPPPVAKPPTCTLTPRVDCPDGYYCQLVEENTGTCVKI